MQWLVRLTPLFRPVSSLGMALNAWKQGVGLPRGPPPMRAGGRGDPHSRIFTNPNLHYRDTYELGISRFLLLDDLGTHRLQLVCNY